MTTREIETAITEKYMYREALRSGRKGHASMELAMLEIEIGQLENQLRLARIEQDKKEGIE